MNAAAAAGQEPHRGLITICVMLATIMQASYIVAAAIMTAPVGWLAVRYGRKRVFIVSAVGFTVASIMCGAAQGIGDMVLYRLLQGVFGAALVPLSQSIMMDIYPPERRGQAMAIWGMGVMLGPIMGPTLGGWLTENYSWRWVFLINLPFGIATVLGLMAFMPDSKPRTMRFDWFGFISLSLFIGVLQLMLDRGETLGWFDSNETLLEATIAGVAAYFFLAHTATADKPFIPPAIFRDFFNFTLGVFFMFIVGILILATIALITPFIQNVLAYPVLSAGILLGTRGVGTMAAMMVVGKLLRVVDARILIASGLAMSTLTLWVMSGISPDISQFTIIWTSIVQGVGLGLIFVPLNTVAFATLPAALRPEATSIWTLIRNLGSSIGVSVVIAQLTSTSTAMHARLAELVTPFSAGLQLGKLALLDPATDQGLAITDRMVSGQAVIISYQNDFLLMALLGAFTIPLIFFFRMRGQKTESKVMAAAAD
jgi:DHA2 family multidrug resistance protein